MNNPVAKHARKFNKSHVYANKRVKLKNGYRKHKGALFNV